MKYLPAGLAVLAALVLAAPANAGVFGAFHADCTFSHRAQDDPIVNFGMPNGASHMHDFSGARTTNAWSTSDSIRNGATNCVRSDSKTPGADHSAYWVPTVYVNNAVVQETNAGVYYTTGPRSGDGIKPFPANLRMIAGNAKGGPQEVSGERVWYYECPGGTAYYTAGAPMCQTNLIELMLRFPDCWNGKDLDSADHKSHMAYSYKRDGAELRTCPSTHPVKMPIMQMTIRYPTKAGSSLRLSSGAINTSHVDFMNGWDMTQLSYLVNNCLVPDMYCGGGDIPMRKFT